MALQRIPTEIWQTILRYSISVPVFFEIDPIEACGFQDFINFYTNTNIYWKVERHRNILRRVCKNWNAYLLRFEHRFVKLEDVAEGVVPISAVQKATRLQYGYTILEDGPEVLLRPIIRQESEPWSLEILHGGVDDLDKLILSSGKVPRLGSIAYTQDLDLDTVSSLAPSLKFLDIYCDTPQYLQQFRMAHLTSISILIDPIPPLLSADLPSLKHLGLYIEGGKTLSVQSYIELLCCLGKNLITLFDYVGFSDEFLPHAIWTLCPNLRRLKTYLAWPADAYIPRSLDSIFLPIFAIDEYPVPTESRLPITALQKAGIATVSLDRSWTKGLLRRTPALMDYASYLIDHGISFYDAAGVKFQDFIVASLRHRKKNIRKPAPHWDPIYGTF